VIATTTQKLQVLLNKQLQKNIKKDSNLFFPTSCNLFIQKQQLETIRIANLNVPNINNKYCSLYLNA
jgi:hypothetical protein